MSGNKNEIIGDGSNIHIISFTEAGLCLSRRLQQLFPRATATSGRGRKLADWVRAHFAQGNALVFVGAAGIAVRAVAPFVKDKKTDSAVIVIDEKASFVIPILSGHIGGANSLARKIADFLKATAVITTASDVNRLPAIDEFAKENNLQINDMKLAKDFAARMLESAKARFTISVKVRQDILTLIPKAVILGIGCKKGRDFPSLREFVFKILESEKIDLRSLACISSIDLKKDEKAIRLLAEDLSLPFLTFSAEKLNAVCQPVSHSDFVSAVTGTDNVCERAVFAAGAERLLVKKTARMGMTLALGLKASHFELPPEFVSAFVEENQGE